MNKENAERYWPKKMQVKVGEKIAYVEIISIKNDICSVEFPGHEPVFITKVKDSDNKSCWISIPQGNNELAAVIGGYIDEQLHSK